MPQTRVLVLDPHFRPLQVVSWQRALSLALSGKAEVLVQHTDTVRTISRVFTLPSILRLTDALPQMARLARFSRKNVFFRDRNQCQYCGDPGNIKTHTLDHVIPKSEGGKSTWKNMVVACVTCNRKKANRTPEQAGLKLLRQPEQPRWNVMFRSSLLERLPRQFGNLPQDWETYLGT